MLWANLQNVYKTKVCDDKSFLEENHYCEMKTSVKIYANMQV